MLYYTEDIVNNFNMLGNEGELLVCVHYICVVVNIIIMLYHTVCVHDYVVKPS